MADFNDDGRLDIYVARLKVGVSSLYLNQGEGRFDDASTRTDVFGLGGQLGACAFDADGDEDLDLLLVRGLFSEDAPHNLLINEGEAHFIDETPPEWRDEPCRNFTVCVGDVDNDGDLDAFRSAPQGCALWLNDGQGAFTRVLEEMVWNELPGSGAVLCDLDDDGDLDILVRVGSTFEEPADEGRPGGGEFLFRNELNNDGWLKVRPVDKRGSHFCHGAQVRVYEAGGLGDPKHFVARRDLTSLCGWVSYGPFVAHFGLKPERTYDVEVRFADGSRGTAPGVKPGRTVEVTAE
jgi:hypothetical protein